MSTNDEYNALVSELESVRSEYYAAQKRIDRYEGLLDRLKPIKTEVSKLKSSFNSQVKTPDERGKESNKWEGTQYEGFQYEVEDIEIENKEYYRGSLDHVLDSINDEITRLENLCLNEYGLLGKLGGMINSLANSIENFFN